MTKINENFLFKVYYKPLQAIYDVINLNCLVQDNIIVLNNKTPMQVKWSNCVILRPTSKRDKRKRLLYEGDIIKLTRASETSDNSQEYIGYIKWFEEFSSLGVKTFGQIPTAFALDDLITKIEYIGNIYTDQETYKLIRNRNNFKHLMKSLKEAENDELIELREYLDD